MSADLVAAIAYLWGAGLLALWASRGGPGRPRARSRVDEVLRALEEAGEIPPRPGPR